MDWHEEIDSGFPPPREGEPKPLRKAIRDELEDHLACASERERTKQLSEPEVQRAVLMRFGNPASIARQLWFYAMKERIMANRILIGINLVLVLFCLVVLGMIVPKLKQLAMQVQKPAVSDDRAMLHMKLVTADGTPAKAKVSATLEGHAFEATSQDRIRGTPDAEGNIMFGPVRAGQYNLRFDTFGPDGEEVYNRYMEATLYGGQTAEKTVTLPTEAENKLTQVTFKPEAKGSPELAALLARPDVQAYVAVCLLPKGVKFGSTEWDAVWDKRKDNPAPNWIIFDKTGEIMTDWNPPSLEMGTSLMRSSRASAPHATIGMPPGRYRILRKIMFVTHLPRRPELEETRWTDQTRNYEEQEPAVMLEVGATDQQTAAIDVSEFGSGLTRRFAPSATLTLEQDDREKVKFHDLSLQFLEDSRPDYAVTTATVHTEYFDDLQVSAGFDKQMGRYHFRSEKGPVFLPHQRGSLTLQIDYDPAKPELE